MGKIKEETEVKEAELVTEQEDMVEEGVEIVSIDEIVTAVIEKTKEMQRTEALTAKIENNKASIKMLEESETIPEEEKEMHISRKKYENMQYAEAMKGEDAIKAMNEKLAKSVGKTTSIQINSADGKGVVEIVLPVEDFGVFNDLLALSAKYWQSNIEILK